jgi:hypothetical protein
MNLVAAARPNFMKVAPLPHIYRIENYEERKETPYP